tara:strand:+ start:1183 stop:1686 length:504 start_codon:yes stop_codon:yes gene_type:complete
MIVLTEKPEVRRKRTAKENLWSLDDWNDILSMYDTGVTLKEISRKYGYKSNFMFRVMEAYPDLFPQRGGDKPARRFGYKDEVSFTRYWNIGAPVSDLCSHFKLNHRGVMKKVLELDLEPRIDYSDVVIEDPYEGQQKIRKCLSCQNDFNSTHFGNRMCYMCKGKDHE